MNNKVQKILFVCSGNQCRSPMAEGILKDMVARDGRLRLAGIEVQSAGTLYFGGASATANAIKVMLDQGIDISQHRSQPITAELCEWADTILVMTKEHEDFILNWVKAEKAKVHLLTEYVGEKGEVDDPVESTILGYRHCAALLKNLISSLCTQLK
jgi:protein-tyrosine-phosphatase